MIIVAIRHPPSVRSYLYFDNYRCRRKPGVWRGAMTVRLEKDGAVGIIVLDRPPANSYDYNFLRPFGAAIDDIRLDQEIRAVVVTSALERIFSTGAGAGGLR